MSKIFGIFSSLYDAVLRWAAHPKAPYFLACLSFSEASFFPIPPDIMLAPMAISRPKRAWWYATLTTFASVLGGVLGYFLGKFFIHLFEPYLIQFGYEAAYYKVKHWFLIWGFWVMFFVGFTPIPYKVFTLSSGAVGMPLFPFILASLIGRGSRFYLVSGLMQLGGERMNQRLRACMDWMGWLFFTDAPWLHHFLLLSIAHDIG